MRLKTNSETLVIKHRALPLFIRGKTLFIALSDPTNLQALDEIKFQSQLHTETILVEEDKLTKAIDIALEADDTSIMDLLGDNAENLDILENPAEINKVNIDSERGGA